MSNSINIIQQPFKGDTVFLMGNEGQGLLDCHKNICDQFVYIPQYTNKTASLNVACAASIVFHHWAMWAQYEECQLFGEKFQQVNSDNNKDVMVLEGKNVLQQDEEEEEKKDNDEVDKQLFQ
ncbi:obp33pep like protein, putative [Ichthyophthirius multifiliis]|uniref:Obp33pep like protein, putative n=1 Tax=Ichthyophthirius multifiliis TaxID=5932 RepID=G0QKL6_ICHMU|nr:obp33pep like protein, putative [Ichthyophthirius multifiliis]EGR34234.1 obp33pep like protein, putative [Ichthyophthirius multifiliis]|eukprot:XP_004039538.1 obp33pep like protein, putative [Ichthyophthirius multifiliis]